jgi:hypothetical protein
MVNGTDVSITQVINGWPDAWGQLRMDDDRAFEYVFEVEDGVLWASSPVPSDAIYWDGKSWCEQE